MVTLPSVPCLFYPAGCEQLRLSKRSLGGWLAGPTLIAGRRKEAAPKVDVSLSSIQRESTPRDLYLSSFKVSVSRNGFECQSAYLMMMKQVGQKKKRNEIIHPFY